MNYDEYVEAQAGITARLVAALVAIFNPFRRPALTPAAWVSLLAQAFRLVNASRTASAELAREFHDAERERQLGPGTPRHDTFLANYDSDWFYEAMEPARKTFSVADADEEALNHAIGIAIKEVENGGRRTTIRAVDTDRRAIGWARVEGGQESCAFCLMLISRGPVYKSARTAGFRGTNTEASQVIASGDESDLAGLMTRWHENCDCKVVAVYDERRWTGRDKYLAAERVWIEAPGRNSMQKLASIRKMLARRGVGEQDSQRTAA